MPAFGLFAVRYFGLPSFFQKKVLMGIFVITLTVTLGNALQIAPNHAKLRENVW